MCIFFYLHHHAHDNALARWSSLMCESTLIDCKPIQPSEEAGLIDIFDGISTTVPQANVELHQMNMMEDRMYALLLLSLSKT